MLDTYDEFSPNNPINQEEYSELDEFEQLEEDYSELRKKSRRQALLISAYETILTDKEDIIQLAKGQIKYLIDLSVDADNGLLLRLLKKIKL